MKKIILSILVLGMVVFTPIAKAETALLSPEVIEQAQTDPEFKALVITYLKTMIQLLQEQLRVMIAQENILNKIAQNATPSQQAPVQQGSQVSNTMAETLKFEAIRSESSVVVVIKEPFETCSLVIKDGQGNVVKNSDQWFKDKDGNIRQVMDILAGGKYSYQMTYVKNGEPQAVVNGNFPDQQ